MRRTRSRRDGGDSRRGGGAFLLSPLGIVFTTVVIDLIGFGIVLPILPLWAEEFGASPVQIGIITASYAVMQFIFAPILGRISDRRGRRPVILVALVGTVIAFLMIGIAQSLLVIFLARVLQGVAGASYAAAQAYVADVTTREERAHGMGMIGAAFGLGFLLGPALGALFALIDMRAPFFVAAALALANLVIAYRRLPESRVAGAPVESRGGWALLRRSLASRRLAPLMWLTFLANFAFVAMESTFALFGERRLDYGMVGMGLLFAYIGLLAAFSQGYLVRRIVPRMGEGPVLTVGLIGTAAGLWLMAVSHNLPLLLVALAILAVASGLVFSATSALISLGSADDEQGAVMGLAASVASAARIAAPLVAGVLFQHIDPAAPLVIGGALFAVCVAGALWSTSRSAVPAS